MMYHNRKALGFVFVIWLLVVLACTPSNPNGNNNGNGENGGQRVDAESNRDAVFIISADGQRQPLNAPDRAALGVNEGIDVDEAGRAILRFADLFSVELLRDGGLTLKELAVDEQSAIVTVIQNGGALLNAFDPDAEISRRFTVETDFAVITATGTRFLVVREANSPLEWVIALDAPAGDLEVTADGATRPVTSGQARWIAPIDAPGAAFRANMDNVQTWLDGLQQGQTVQEIGEVVWEPANTLANTSPLRALPAIGEPFNLGTEVVITMEPPTTREGGYWLADCNGDGVDDILMRDGRLQLDFRPALSRVSALDVTVVNLDEPGGGQVRVLDPARQEISAKRLTAATNTGEVLDFRHDVPYHYAEISMSYGCFLGFSLTPPRADGSPGPARPATTGWQESNASEWARPPENGELFASLVSYDHDDDVGELAIYIDGRDDDWQFLTRMSGVGWTLIEHVVHDEGCRAGLAAAVQFAYDEAYLYVAFIVQDSVYSPYSGSDQAYFLGDSPQLLLDLDLIGDFYDADLSDDDVQIDFHPGFPQPGRDARAALWRLHAQPLISRQFEEAIVAATPTSSNQFLTAPVNNGYFLEAALPWDVLGVRPEPGLKLGVAASVSDNNSQGVNRQECMISTAPDRNWRSPLTWGTLTLGD